LAIGVAFGSHRIEETMELGPASRDLVPPETAARILAFDFWIRNDDRRMDECGGNSNLLWDPRRREVWVFDHNLAFESGITDGDLVQRHAFGGTTTSRDNLTGQFRTQLEERMRAAIGAWPTIAARVPHEWLYQDGACTIPVSFDLKEFLEVLTRLTSDPAAFWRSLA